MTQISDLTKEIKKYNSGVAEKIIRDAYDFAKESHESQMRMSGEPFINHPLEVAFILARLGMDTSTIVAALLHDVPEDTNRSVEEIEKKFGSEVAYLIDGVTKLAHIKVTDRKQRQVENLRKMFIATAKDIRVMLIKLADRVHNMRTISFLGDEKAKRIATETLEIYAPLAHRLGIYSIKDSLEDMAFQTLYPQKFEQIKKMVAENKAKREKYLTNAISIMKKELKKLDIKADITGRSKHFYSIYEKMHEKGKDFNEIYDLSAIRVIVDSVSDCYAALGAIHNIWKPIPGRFKDYIAMPKGNGYQSLHTTVIGPEGKSLETQIRTNEMHQASEYGIAAHWMYKDKHGKQKNEQSLWLKQMAEWQKDQQDPKEFLESLKFDLFQDEVFVFTPNGDIVSLPYGSTPLDFAYNIHSEVGNHCIGAKIDGQIVPLEYKLQMGDRVEILTSKNAAPSKDWLKLAKTAKARNRIKHWFSQEEKDDSLSVGREELQKALRKHKISLKVAKSKLMDEIAQSFNFNGADDLYASIGAGNTSPQQVVTKLVSLLNKEEEEEDEETKIEEIKLTKPTQNTSSRVGIKVKGVGDILIRLARCCNPVPPDDIIGFVTRGRGISVHRKDCTNAVELMKTPERIIEVSWDVGKPTAFQVEVQVEALDRVKLLRDISTVLSDLGVNILSASVTTTKDGFAIFRFIFEIADLAYLDHVLKNVRKIDAVADAFRV